MFKFTKFKNTVYLGLFLFIIETLFCVNCYGFDQAMKIGRKSKNYCYDSLNRPQRCYPEFENAAFSLEFEATNTCGEKGPQEYCEQSGITVAEKSCQICYPGKHHSRFMTDYHNVNNLTWWQSETMFDGIQYPNQVNLTLNLRKAFDVTFVRLWFMSPRPESFRISKRTTKSGPWIPWQYYSATCQDTYGLPDQSATITNDETRALCTSEYSDILPLKGGNVAFGTLEFRPSANDFDSSPELQEWVTATEIMITLDRLNTFGDEVFGDPQVLRSYFYAIADISIGARCKCNGHASECVISSVVGWGIGGQRKTCKCEHNTGGPDCSECLPFYNDLPWRRATAKNAYKCQKCNCNGFSNRCIFDAKLYEQTGHGGHCLDCLANRDGPNCERCNPNFYMREDGHCAACECDEVGSRDLQCNSEGKCQCKGGVIGDKCNRCAPNYFDLSSSGCKPCNCYRAGSFNNEPTCDPVSGLCDCKENVEGKQCNECKPGYFNLDMENQFGCTPCFCYGHSSKCDSAQGYFKNFVESSFNNSTEKWMIEDVNHQMNKVKHEPVLNQSIGVQSVNAEAVYFIAPEKFLGNQRNSYNHLLEVSLKIGEGQPTAFHDDIILEGGGMIVTNIISSQHNKLPTIGTQTYKLRLHEHPDFGWFPKQTSRSFLSLLSNLTAIKIRATYSPREVGFLDHVKLETATKGVSGVPALWVERCECPQGYIGQYCESCAPGFRHRFADGNPLTDCVSCDCNGHANICDSETGKCICEHNTAGENCHLCAKGFYGNALAGTSNDCQSCDCPHGGPCTLIDENTMVCTECPAGYGGAKCDTCADGYFGDPLGLHGLSKSCQKCDCNGNIDLNAIGNCDTTTGKCLKCIHFTDGEKCEKCLPGYFGDALALPKSSCKKCQCYQSGTKETTAEKIICNQITGACECKLNVIGANCDECLPGYFNIDSGEGCHSCNCDPIGSLNQTCDPLTGQCFCRRGVTGLRCDHCEAKKYGFSLEGCTDCNCDHVGSKDLQCDATGQCPCLENVEGKRCDQCKENKHDKHKGCVDCPECYNLVQNENKNVRKKLVALVNTLDEFENQSKIISDEQFSKELNQFQKNLGNFENIVQNATSPNNVFNQLKVILKQESEISGVLSEIDEESFLTKEKAQLTENNNDHTDEVLVEAEFSFNEMEIFFKRQGKNALDEATKRSEIVGQHSEKMSNIAHEALELSSYLNGKSNTLVSEANNAKNLSLIAYDNSKDINIKNQLISNNISHIKIKLLDEETKLKKTKPWAKNVANDAERVKDDALTLLNEVNSLIISTSDTEKLKVKTNSLKNEVYKIRNNTKELFASRETIRQSVEEKNSLAKELLARVKEEQGELDDLKSDMGLFDDQANQAISLLNEVVGIAETNYKLLADFDTQTQTSKNQATQALETILQIEKVIKESKINFNAAQNTLDDATVISHTALEKAIEAKNLAKNASNKATKIKSNAKHLYQNTTFLSDEAGLMYDRVINTEGELRNILDIARNNNSLINEAKEKVGRAGKDTKSASKRVTDLIRDVEAIIFELQNTPDITEEDIDRLEEELRVLEDRLAETRLEEKLEGLQKEYKMQNDLIEQYKNQIKILEKDVSSIEQIVKALPQGCFTDSQLEP